jgi:hypothetical protein
MPGTLNVCPPHECDSLSSCAFVCVTELSKTTVGLDCGEIDNGDGVVESSLVESDTESFLSSSSSFPKSQPARSSTRMLGRDDQPCNHRCTVRSHTFANGRCCFHRTMFLVAPRDLKLHLRRRVQRLHRRSVFENWWSHSRRGGTHLRCTYL